MNIKYRLLTTLLLPVSFITVSYAASPAIIIARHAEKNKADNNKMTPAGIWHSQHYQILILKALYSAADIMPLTNSGDPANIDANQLRTIYPGAVKNKKSRYK